MTRTFRVARDDDPGSLRNQRAAASKDAARVQRPLAYQGPIADDRAQIEHDRRALAEWLAQAKGGER